MKIRFAQHRCVLSAKHMRLIFNLVLNDAAECSGSTSNIETRGGTLHVVPVLRLNSSVEYSGYSLAAGTISAVSSTTVFSLAADASPLDGAYNFHALTIGSETRTVLQYVAATKTVTIDLAFTTTPTAGSSTCVPSRSHPAL
jgi:hypothetical protein